MSNEIEQIKLGNTEISYSEFTEKWKSELLMYKRVILRDIYDQAKVCYETLDKTLPDFKLKPDTTMGLYFDCYVSSKALLDQKLESFNYYISGPISFVESSGVDVSSGIISTCNENGIACIRFDVSDFDHESLIRAPYSKYIDSAMPNTEYIPDGYLPVSILSSALSNMPLETKKSIHEKGTPDNMKDLQGVFSYEKGLSSEFGVLLIENFTHLNLNDQGLLYGIISEPEHGIRRWPVGGYILPPYWMVVCVMKEGYNNITENTRQLLSARGFYRVKPD